MLPHVQLSTNCGLDCFLQKDRFPINQLAILQLVDDCTSGKVTFSLYKYFPSFSIGRFEAELILKIKDALVSFVRRFISSHDKS